MPNLNQNGAENNEQTNAGLHPEVEERLKWWAEKHSKTLDDATGDFYTYLKAELGVDNPDDEDDVFMIDAAETFVVERRVMSGGTNNATDLVNASSVLTPSAETHERKRPLHQAALSDLDGAIADGTCRTSLHPDGVWMPKARTVSKPPKNQQTRTRGSS